MGTASENQADVAHCVDVSSRNAICWNVFIEGLPVQPRSKDIHKFRNSGAQFQVVANACLLYYIRLFIYVYVRFYFYRALSQIGDLKKKLGIESTKELENKYNHFPSEEMSKQSW